MPLIIRSHIKYDPPKPKAGAPKAPEVKRIAPAILPARAWQKDELELMARLYRVAGPTVLAARFGRSAHAVWNKAQSMGLRGPGPGRKSPLKTYPTESGVVENRLSVVR